jgi:flagellar protein FlgJ
MTAAITDFNQFTGLRAAANQNDPAALREVAGQFEALFMQTILKNMREASLGDPIFGNSDQQEMYQGMMDQQLALEMSSGKGIGLADMLVRQLGGTVGPELSHPDRDFRLSDVPRVSRRVSAETEPAWSDPKAFVRDIWPHAERAGRRLNVAPEAIVAQAALETGWGAHVMPDSGGDSSFNLFGIKTGAGWQGDQVSRQTLEFENGVPRPQRADFRAYSDVAATFDDYTEFLTDNPRYSGVSGHGADVAGFANALQSSGYATDPNYADKLTRIMESPTMRSVINDLKNSRTPPISAQLSLRAQ